MKKEIQIALLAIVTLSAAVWGLNFIAGKSLFSGDKSYYTIFDNVKDVNTATPVLINGFQVGTVVSILPEPDDISKIRVEFIVKKEIKLPNYAIAELRSASALGGKEIELVFDKMCIGDNCAEPKSTLKGLTKGILGSMISAEELGPHIESVTSALETTINTLGDPESNAPLNKTIRDLSAAMKSLSNSTKSLETLMATSSKNLEITLANMSQLTGTLVDNNDKLTTILNNISVASDDISKVKLSETMDKTNSTMDQAQLSLQSLESTMTNAGVAITELNELLIKMDSEEGTLGNLINNKVLYDNIESSSKNLDLLLQDLRLNPRRYFKLFGKKSKDYEYPLEDPGANPGETK